MWDPSTLWRKCKKGEEEVSARNAHNGGSKAAAYYVLPWSCTLDILHLKIKKLSMNSLKKFNSVLDTINYY